MAVAFGDFFLNGHPSIITGKIKKAQCANPAVYALKNKCLVVFQEIETDEESIAKVNFAKLIEFFSGNDVKLTARTLYKAQDIFYTNFSCGCLSKHASQALSC